MCCTIPMTREEMLKRVEKGEDVWDIVFDKWKRLKMFIENHDVSEINLLEVAYGATCALCEVHTIESSSAIECFGYKHGMLPCPLVQIDERCGKNAWSKFVENPSTDNIQLMINTLKRARYPSYENNM